jgi:hypothetical protein
MYWKTVAATHGPAEAKTIDEEENGMEKNTKIYVYT